MRVRLALYTAVIVSATTSAMAATPRGFLGAQSGYGAQGGYGQVASGGFSGQAPAGSSDAQDIRLEDYEAWASVQRQKAQPYSSGRDYLVQRARQQLIANGYVPQEGEVVGPDGAIYPEGYPPGGFGGGPGCMTCGPMMCGDPCCPGAYVYAETELLYLRPHFENGTGVFLDPFNLPLGTATTAEDFDYNFEPAWRFAAGAVTDCGFGFRAAYFFFDHSADNNPQDDATNVGATPFIAPDNGNFQRLANAQVGDVLITSHDLRLHAVDLEFTNDMAVCNNTLRLSGGVRYAEEEQHYRAANTRGIVVLDGFQYDHDFSGLGPTFGLSVMRHVATSGLGFYVDGRTSLLFGRAEQTLVNSPATNVAALGVAISDNNSQIIITEIALGASYDHGPFFVRSGFEAQVWEGAGGPTDASSDFSLYGFSFVTGIRR